MSRRKKPKKRPSRHLQPHPQQSATSAGRHLSPAQMLLIQEESYSGPLPHPKILQGFEDVQPGFADRIVAQFEKEGESRRELTRTYIRTTLRMQMMGQVMAFVLFLAILGVAFWLLDHGHTALGTGFAMADATAAATVLITGRSRSSKTDE
jgi:uncharacterized membrane protein